MVTDPRASRLFFSPCNMDRGKILAFLLYRRRTKRKRKNRLIWVHPINQSREEFGHFYTLFTELSPSYRGFTLLSLSYHDCTLLSPSYRGSTVLSPSY